MEKNLEKLFADEIADIYDAEQQILKALPKMIKAASASELQEALEQHRTVTEGHVQRLEQIFRELGEHPKKKCKGMAGLLAEGEEMIDEDLPDNVKDAGLIGAAQKVEHYEMAAYGTARTLAEFLGNEMAVDLLQQTLDEEKEADELLSQIAETCVNVDATSESGEDEEEESEKGEGATSRRTARAPARAKATAARRKTTRK
jgi:ferritin-like metal-binding protein YciE